MSRRLVSWVAAAVATVSAAQLVSAPGAFADADPPSDILLMTPVYYPYQPPVSRPVQDALNRVVGQLNSGGLDVRVAVIAAPADLGAVPWFGRPQYYAGFLEKEIQFRGQHPLLVVMPAGFGTALIQPSNVLAGLRVDSSHGSDGLALSAIHALGRIAAAAGRPITIGQLPAPAGVKGAGGGPSPLLTFGGPILLIALSILALERFRQRREATGG